MDDLTAIMKTAIECQKQGRLDEAETIYLTVLEIDAANADARHLLGLVYHAKGDFNRAAEAIGAAVLARPKVADYHANLSATLLSLGQPRLAATHATRAVELDPSLGTAHYNLGNAFFSLGETDSAVRAFREALEQDPANEPFWANYLFALNFAPAASRELISQANCRWGDALIDVGGEEGFNLLKKPERKLRLAYYLPELDRHVTVRFLNAMLPHHDRKNFEILIYGYRVDGGPAPKSLFEWTDRWIDISGRPDEATAELIRHDQVDILLHPCTFKARYRTILAYTPAPLRVACVNLVSTTGLAATTHLVTDAFLDPPGETENYYKEDLIRLSGFNVYQPPDVAPDVSPLPALDAGYVTFGSFNNPAKLTPETLALWADILRQVPQSRLFLKHRALGHEDVQTGFLKLFRDVHIDENRIVFEGFSPDSSDYLSAYHNVDIGLDPLPFGGGTTTYESLWMGVPVVTLAGHSLMGRLSASLMHRLGHPEFVRATPEDYVAAAVRLAGDPDKLGELRGGLRQTAQETIFDGWRFVSELEDALRALWRDYCRNG